MDKNTKMASSLTNEDYSGKNVEAFPIPMRFSNKDKHPKLCRKSN
jgi:hypothetical protein